MNRFKVILTILVIINMFMLLSCSQSGEDFSNPESTNNTSFSEKFKKADDELCVQLDEKNETSTSDMDIDTDTVETTEIIRKIDERVSWIIKNEESQIATEYESFEDFRIQSELVRRYFVLEYVQDEPTIYYLYYDNCGSLIFAEIAHYRSYLYSIYFDKDELLYVYWDENSNLNGDLANVESLIEEDSNYSVILDDVKEILEYAYKASTQP